MSKDPRFNFYPDNWSGGTKRMTFEQKGAYFELLLLNFYCLSDGLPGFTEQEAARVLADAAAYAELWSFLKPKFSTDGKYFCSDRMLREFEKSKKQSKKQSERANKRWASKDAYAAAYALDGNGNGNGNGKEGGVEETNSGDLEMYDEWTDMILSGNDQFFEQKFMKEKIPRGPDFDFWVKDHRDMLNRYPKMRPPNQGAFTNSCIKHIRENYKKQNGINGRNHKGASGTTSAIIDRGKDYSSKL